MNNHEKNLLVELPKAIKFKIEVEAEKETSKVMDGIFTIEKRVDQIMYLRDAYKELLQRAKSDEYFKLDEIEKLNEVIQRNASKKG